MSYLVLARKWRPRQFEDVVGQDHVVTTLKNAITMNRVAHAYLFSGPRGIGKTSTARILAKALNCKKGPTVTPCDECVNCTEISAGSSLDVLEIDGASNRGIDQVRELRENVKFVPAHARFKIYIIDEVHMLTQEAFNALLKTLEEPPEHVKFFFATTELHKVPQTILSRCQRFGLRKISTQEILQTLKEIIQKEKIKTDEKTLFAIAKGSDGSLRDAEGLLDQLVSFSEGELKYEDALEILGWIPREDVSLFIESLKGGDWKALFSLIGKMDLQGKDLGSFISELRSHFRDLLLLRTAPESPESLNLVELPSEELNRAKTQSAYFSKDQLLEMLELCLDAEDRIKNALSKRSTVEALAMRLSWVSQSATLEGVVEKLDALQRGAQNLSESFEGLKKKNLSDPWERVLKEIAEKKPLLHAYLKDATPVWERDRLQLLFSKEKQFSLEALKPPEHQGVILDLVSQAYGSKPTMELGLLPGENSATPLPAQEDRKSSASVAFQDDPMVQKALEIFQGKITEIKK